MNAPPDAQPVRPHGQLTPQRAVFPNQIRERLSLPAIQQAVTATSSIWSADTSITSGT